MKEVRSIRWTRGAIKHIAKHNIEPFEVEEALFEDKPIIRRGGEVKIAEIYTLVSKTTLSIKAKCIPFEILV